MVLGQTPASLAATRSAQVIPSVVQTQVELLIRPVGEAVPVSPVVPPALLVGRVTAAGQPCHRVDVPDGLHAGGDLVLESGGAEVRFEPIGRLEEAGAHRQPGEHRG